MKPYVYVFMDPRKPGLLSYNYYDWTFKFTYEPFYVGIASKEGRILLCKNRNRYFANKVAKMQRSGFEPILFQFRRATWRQVCLLEIILIKSIGRWDKKKGPLVNFTDGGEGSWGRKLSPESIAKMKASLKGRSTRSPEVIRRTADKLTGGKHTQQTRKNMSIAQKKRYQKNPMTDEHIQKLTKARERNGTNIPWNKGLKRSKKTRDKISKSLIGNTPHNKKFWRIIFPDGREKTVWDLFIFAEVHNLTYNTLRSTGGRRITNGSCEGYRCYSI